MKKTLSCNKNEIDSVLTEEKDRSQRYLDLSGVLFVALNCSGKVTLANKKTCEVLGSIEKEIVGKSWFNTFIPKRLRSSVIEVFDQIVNGNIKPVKYYENPILCSNGEERIIAWHNSILQNEAGEVIGLLSSGDDITDRKQAEEKLKQSEEKLQSYFDNAPDGVIVADSSKKFIEVNPAICKMFGYTKNELLNLYCPNLLEPESLDEVNAHFDRVSEKGFDSVEFEGVRKDKSNLYFSVDTVKLSENRFMGFLKDITERKRAENILKASEMKYRENHIQLIESQLAIENKNNALSELVEHVEREKKELVTQIRNNLDRIVGPILLRLETQINESQINQLEIIRSTINDLTDPFIDKIEFEKKNLTAREFEICNFIKSGYSSKEIAQTLNTSIATVKTQRKSIRRKLCLVKSQENLASYLMRK